MNLSSCYLHSFIQDKVFSFLNEKALYNGRLVCTEWNQSLMKHVANIIFKEISFNQKVPKDFVLKEYINKSKWIKSSESPTKTITKISIKTSINYFDKNQSQKNWLCHLGNYLVVALDCAQYAIFDSTTSKHLHTIDDHSILNFTQNKQPPYALFQAYNDELFLTRYQNSFVLRQAKTGKEIFKADYLPPNYFIHFYKNSLFYLDSNLQLSGYSIKDNRSLKIMHGFYDFLPTEPLCSTATDSYFYIWGKKSGCLQLFDLDATIIKSSKINLKPLNKNKDNIDYLFDFSTIKKINSQYLIATTHETAIQEEGIEEKARLELISLKTGEILQSFPLPVVSVSIHSTFENSKNFICFENQLIYIEKMDETETETKTYVKSINLQTNEIKTVSFPFKISHLFLLNGSFHALSLDGKHLKWINPEYMNMFNEDFINPHYFLDLKYNSLLLLETIVSSKNPNKIKIYKESKLKKFKFYNKFFINLTNKINTSKNFKSFSFMCFENNRLILIKTKNSLKKHTINIEIENYS